MTYSKEEQKEYHRKWREKNRDKIKEKKAEYYRVNKEKSAEYSKKRYQLNKEKISEKRSEYYQLNREKIIEYKREQRKEGKAYCVEYLGGKCVKCGTTHNLQFDHIKREGKKYNIASRVHLVFTILKEELDKCQLLCVDCHKVKTISERTK